MYKIAICGKANSGKNTLGKMLVRQLRKEIKKGNYLSATYMAFADPIKQMIREMFPGLPEKFLTGSSKYRSEIIPGAFKDGKPLSVRQLLIDLGTEIGRSYKETIWLDNFDFHFESLRRRIVVVTDVRFRNEFDHLRNKGFYLIKLYRETDGPGINHVSETNQNTIGDSEFDYVIHNDKSLADLKKVVINDIIPNLKDN